MRLPISHILYPTDFSALANEGERTAAQVARATGAKVTVVHVDEGDRIHRYWQYDPKPGIRTEADRREKIAARLDQELNEDIWEGLKVEKIILEGDAAFEIVGCAKRRNVDLIVIPCQGESPYKENLLGGTARKVAEQAPCSVLLVRRQGMLESYASAKSKAGKSGRTD